MGSAASPLPYQQVTTTSELPQWKKELYGFTKNAPEYSPFKALSRQAGTQAKIIEGMTSRPSWSSMYEAFGVQPGTDLTPYIQAMRTGTQAPQAPIPASPAAGDIPAFVPPSEQAAPKKEAAQGGLMSLRKGYARGGAPRPAYNKNSTADDRLSALRSAINSGYRPTAAETTFMQNMADTADLRKTLGTSSNVPYTVDPKTGTIKPAARGADQSTADYTKYLNTISRAGVAVDPKTTKQYGVQTREQQLAAADQNAPGGVPLSQAMNVVTPFYDVNQQYGQYGGVTNPIYQQALDQLRAVSQAPSQFEQGTGIMSTAANRLLAQGDYKPQNIDAPQINRASIRDVAALQAPVERMRGAQNVRGATMSGPQSWTQQGTAEAYMNPYIETALESQQRLANRQFAQQQNQLRSQATGQKAFGGSRETLAEQNAQLNQNIANQNLAAQGLNTAYQQGMGQFSTEQGMGQQAKQVNVGSLNQANLANQLYGMGGFQSQAANQAAQNQAYNNYVQQQLTAQGMNQGMDWNTASQNATMILQAAIQNQQAGLTAQGLNLQALNQAGQMGQGIGALGGTLWGLQQNIPQMWGQAGQTVQGIAQQAATGAQQTGINWWGGMNNAYAPVNNLLSQTPGTTAQQNVAQAPRMV